jgi:ABC-type transport system involved in cytochrome bd biosynthesis fused ATPase/permease subunit
MTSTAARLFAATDRIHPLFLVLLVPAVIAVGWFAVNLTADAMVAIVGALAATAKATAVIVGLAILARLAFRAAANYRKTATA